MLFFFHSVIVYSRDALQIVGSNSRQRLSSSLVAAKHPEL